MAEINIKGEIGKDYLFSQYLKDFAKAKSAKEPISLFIDSVGGNAYQGKMISDHVKINADSFLSVQNSGKVASIASDIFLSLPFEKRFYDINNGYFVIHNPFLPASSLADTTADGLNDAVSVLREVENDLLNRIVENTGADADAVKAIMKVNEPLTSEQIQMLNIANIEKLQIVAYYEENLNNKKMTNEELQDALQKGNETLIDKIKALFKKDVKAMSITDAEGNVIEFPEVESITTLKVGDKASTNVSGDIVLADGRTVTMENGVVMGIVEPAPEPTELEEAKAKIEELEKQLQAKMVENKDLSGLLEKIKTGVMAHSVEQKPANQSTSKRKLTDYIK
jgi:ATP-dependent protease ClpP protease subunit